MHGLESNRFKTDICDTSITDKRLIRKINSTRLNTIRLKSAIAALIGVQFIIV